MQCIMHGGGPGDHARGESFSTIINSENNKLFFLSEVSVIFGILDPDPSSLQRIRIVPCLSEII